MRKNPRRQFISLAAILTLLVAPALALAKSTITLSGSTSIYPLAVALAKGYVHQYPGKAGFRILQGGSDIGINDVAHGRVSIGESSRDKLPSDPGGLSWYKIARDGICIITNPSNPVSNLSTTAVQDIFDGTVRDWSGVPGASATGAIDLISRSASSGTADAFQNIFLGQNLSISQTATQEESNGLVQQAVRSDPNAIGYVSFDFIAGTHAIPYEGTPCTLRNAKSGQYSGVRNFWLITRGQASGPAKAFINWVQKSSQADKIVASNWVPLH